MRQAGVSDKAADAFRTISEAAEQLGLQQHVLRHWEEVFGHIRPMRRAGGRRYYRTQDLELLSGVKTLLHDERYTTKGVQKIFKENGSAYVAEIGRKAMRGETVETRLNAGSFDAEDREEKASDAAGSDVGDGAVISKPVLHAIVERLEKVQDQLDEALLAVDTLKAMDGPQEDLDEDDEE